MKKSIINLATTTALVGGLAFAVSGAVVAGIANTKHNLGSTSTTGAEHSGTAEICVFCHTPHGSATGASAAGVPLWNKTLPGAGTYTTYDTLGTSSRDGSVASVGSVSLACLSCHDGSQAMDTMLNRPGSGNTALSGSWTGAGAGGIINGTDNSFPRLGTDLTNDHPVGIEYAGGGCGAGALCDVSATAKDKDFVDAQWKQINGQDVWWVDVASGATLSGTVIIAGNSGSRDKTDMQLYTRNSGPYVECASCHDPHVENDTFLRVENDSSTVCLSCHVK